MNISRGEVSEFQYSSTMGTSAQTILQLGTADNDIRKVRVADLKMSCGATGRTVKFYVTSYADYGQALEFDLPADSSHNFKWEIPYKMVVVGSTGESRRFVSSASGAGVKFSVSGYIEK